jgi:hypothetical protein
MSRRFVVPQNSTSLYFIIFGLFLTWWLHFDKSASGFRAPYEFDTFVLYMWPLLVPYYMYRTRGWKGILFGMGFWVLCLAPTIVAAAVATFVYR